MPCSGFTTPFNMPLLQDASLQITETILTPLHLTMPILQAVATMLPTQLVCPCVPLYNTTLHKKAAHCHLPTQTQFQRH
jgi:hypothetical protein